jgi:peptidoglycan pentaglycine glycine transferase (the first glycine)
MPGSNCRVFQSTLAPDADWDRFLLQIPGPHHPQSSLWALSHACLGWQCVRVTIREGLRVLAGAQALYKPLGAMGSVGYIPKGPVFAVDDAQLRSSLFSALADLARDQHIFFLAVQPPAEASGWLHEMHSYEFHPSTSRMAPTASVMLDLSLDQQSLLNGMRLRTRYNIRLSRRRGIRVREGSFQDLDLYYELVLATASRKGFSPPPKELFTQIWRLLAPQGHVALLVAEDDGRAVSAQLLVTFGDTAVNQLSVWSGEGSGRKPNEALHWEAILWAKARGYSSYDFEGIAPDAARAVLAGQCFPSALLASYTWFKLGFGGRPTLLPGVYEYFPDPAMRAVYEASITHFGWRGSWEF